jgi:hypothetical protein
MSSVCPKSMDKRPEINVEVSVHKHCVYTAANRDLAQQVCKRIIHMHVACSYVRRYLCTYRGVGACSLITCAGNWVTRHVKRIQCILETILKYIAGAFGHLFHQRLSTQLCASKTRHG